MTIDAAAYAVPPADRFHVGDVVSETFVVMGRKLPILLILVALCLVVPALLSGALLFSTSNGARPAASIFEAMRGSMDARKQLNPILNSFLSLLSFGGSLYFQAATMQTVLGDLTREGSKRDGLMLAWQRVLPLLGVIVLVTLAVSVGSILLLVPGIMIALALAVATPVIVWEPGRGVIGAIQRSRDLTRGYRWRVFLLGLLYFAASGVLIAVGVLLNVVLHLPIAVWALSGGALITAVSNLFTAVGVSVLYCELRRVKEGGGAAQVAAAFA